MVGFSVYCPVHQGVNFAIEVESLGILFFNIVPDLVYPTLNEGDVDSTDTFAKF
jgi:hypothetical protein